MTGTKVRYKFEDIYYEIEGEYYKDTLRRVTDEMDRLTKTGARILNILKWGRHFIIFYCYED